ncbi:MAG: hypothetical protein BWX88_04981 [Planctomycetes bacterium ADurb.Bin126]|nr:MAG: hypothetical protein BWX88_04981 [Planctomycetes bacterium ADurb.Bin126]HOD81045.1 DUF5615 family PIN-like protein [Phycisphaerae bacterium]HQL75663.1 DUF5615 family PIN-like protein [Phycisphaerae bacterium]
MEPSVRFYTDEHISHAVAIYLRQRGVDVVTAVDAGLLGAIDEAHLSYAWKHRRVLVTRDSDFLGLNAAGHKHAGIAFVPRAISIGAVLRGLLIIHTVYSAREMRGRVEFVT